MPVESSGTTVLYGLCQRDGSFETTKNFPDWFPGLKPLTDRAAVRGRRNLYLEPTTCKDYEPPPTLGDAVVSYL